MNKTIQTANLFVPALGALAIVAIIGILLAFHAVVQGAVQNGEARRQAGITQADAIWRCKLLRDLSERDSCLQQANVVAMVAP